MSDRDKYQDIKDRIIESSRAFANRDRDLLSVQASKIAEIHRAQAKALAEKEEAQFASGYHKRLVEWINEFDSHLDETEEVGVRLVSFGSVINFHLRDIYFSNPYLIGFIGETDDGQTVELIQHVSQISILLMKLPRKNTEEPKRKLGF